MNRPGITFAIFKEIMNEKFLGFKKRHESSDRRGRLNPRQDK